MNAACNLGMNSKYGIIMKLIAEEVSIRNYAQQFLNFLLRCGGGWGEAKQILFALYDNELAKDSPHKPHGGNLFAACYPLAVCEVCCLNQITRHCVNYRSL